MKNKILYICLCFIFFTNLALAQTTVTKKIVLEELTASWCGLCPSGSLTFDNLLQQYDNVIGVAHHVSDPMATISTNELADAYSGGGVNIFMIDRYLFEDENFVQFSFEAEPIREKIEERLNQETIVSVGLENISFDATTRNLSLDVNANFYDNDLISNDLRINLWIIEDSISSLENAYQQVNYFDAIPEHEFGGVGNPIPNFVHKRVLRKAINGMWGNENIVNSLSENISITQSYNVEIDEKWDISQLYLVALVQQFEDENLTQREILNAEEIKLTTALDQNTTSINPLLSDVYEQNAKIKILPNPFETATKISFQLPKTKKTKIKILNLQGETLTHLRNEIMNKGWHTIDYNIQNNNNLLVEKGIYILHIQQDNFIVTEKIIIL
ncbi:MAG: Omp28-related outer membrane protein [Chitinophagales bacterium]